MALSRAARVHRPSAEIVSLTLLLGIVALGGCAHPAATRHEVAAPVWRVGDSWNYTTQEAGHAPGWRRYTVAEVGPFTNLSALAYRVDWVGSVSGAGDREGPGLGATDRGTQWFDAATLHTLWDYRPDCQVAGSCYRSFPSPYDFPLWDNKTWSHDSDGADITFFVATVHAGPGPGNWTIIHASGKFLEVTIYNEAHRAVVQGFREYKGEVLSRLDLTDAAPAP